VKLVDDGVFVPEGISCAAGFLHWVALLSVCVRGVGVSLLLQECERGRAAQSTEDAARSRPGTVRFHVLCVLCIQRFGRVRVHLERCRAGGVRLQELNKRRK
jgi:hypothetical protein